MSQSTVDKYFWLSFEMIKSNVMTAMEYRTSFLIQVVGMIVNDVGLILIWVIFFQKFPAINGWSFSDSAMLFAITTSSFGILMTLCRGAYSISETITKGGLDYFLALPKNVLWHITVSKSDSSAIGDFFFGLGMFFLTTNPDLQHFFMYIGYTVLASTIMFGFILVTQSLTFWLGNFQEASEQIFHLLVGFTLYPQSVFHGAMKIFMLTLVPGFFVATVPVEIIKNFDPVLFFLMVGYAMGIVTLGISLFHLGLRRYESGNLLGSQI